MICCTVVRPSTDSGLDSVASHSSPSWTAMSPPASQMNGSAAYQYLPGK